MLTGAILALFSFLFGFLLLAVHFSVEQQRILVAVRQNCVYTVNIRAAVCVFADIYQET